MAKIKKLQDVLIDRWRDVAHGPTLMDIVYRHGHASHAILYAALYIPELIEICDSILLKWNVPDQEARDRFLTGLKEGRFSREELEASFNLVEVGYLFSPQGQDTTDEEDQLLAELLSTSWAGYLRCKYPDREFVVEVLSPEDIGSTVGLHFYESRRMHESSTGGCGAKT